MTGWMSGGGGMMAAACEETWASGFELFLEEIKQDERNVVFDFWWSKIQKLLYNDITSYLVSGATAGAAEVVTWEGAVADGATAAASGGVGVVPRLGPAPVDVGGAMTPEGILL